MFDPILQPLLELPGVRGIVFCDREGYTVHAFGASGRHAPEERDDFELKVTGAQFATPLDQALQLARDGLGRIQECLLRGSAESLLVHVLPDGYYLILVLEAGAPTARAFQLLRVAAAQVATEI